MDIIEKAERLQELAGHLETGTPAASLVNAALELVLELARKISHLEEAVEALNEQADDLEDALEEIAADVYGGEGEDDVFEVECPGCGELIQIDEGILQDGSITCPGCDETLEFEFGCDCEGCDCEDCDCEDCDCGDREEKE